MNRNIKTIVVTLFVVSISSNTWFFLFPIFLKNLGASDKNVAFSYTILTFLITSGQYIGGIFSDKWGRKPVITYPTLIIGILLFALSYSKHWTFAIIVMGISHFISSFQMPAFTALIGESSEKEKGKIFGYTELAYFLGCATGPLIGALLLTWFNLNIIMRLSSSLVFVAFILRLLYLEETFHSEHQEINIKGIVNPLFIVFLAAGIFFYLMDATTVWGPFITLHMKEFLKFNKKNINLLFSLGAFLQAIVSISAGRISDKIGHIKSMMLGMLGHSSLLLLWSFLSRGELTYILVPFSFMFIQFSYISYQVIINLITHRKTRGRAIGLFGTVAGLISSLGPMIGYWLKKNISPQGPFMGAFAFAIISTIFLVILKNLTKEDIIGS